MKKFVLFGLLLVFSVGTFADEINFYYCGGSMDEDSYYFNLFMQEIVDDPQYYPFLKTYADYYVGQGSTTQRDENIEQWQAYLKLDYDQTAYLVFKAAQKDLRTLVKGGKISDEALAFADANFVEKYRQSLLYLAYAKFLEPYMKRSSESYYGNQWSHSKEQDVSDLDYEEVKKVLKQSWKAEDDKELKLRYGYQLVRLAHYTNHFQEAVDYFEEYVEQLNHRPIIYYYALDQKAGAERGLGNYIQANADFFTFFVQTKNRKQMAYQSMKLTKEMDLEALLERADSEKARNDVYLLLGYNDFNNPLSSVKNIIETTPDAIQAKVLMARAVNQLEREILPTEYYCYNESDGCLDEIEDKRIPFVRDQKQAEFLDQALSLAQQQSGNKDVKDVDFWKLTTAYLAMLKKDYKQAKTYLNQVKSEKAKYKTQKKKLALLLELLHQDELDEDFENHFLADYQDALEDKNVSEYGYDFQNATGDFIRDVLANRYFLQKEYGKAFLVQNKITALESNPDFKIIEDLEKLIGKSSKNDFEVYLLKSAFPSYLEYDQKTYESDVVHPKSFDYAQYLAHMKGTRYLANEDFEKAKSEFKQLDSDFSLPRNGFKGWQQDEHDFDGYSDIPSSVFGVKFSGRFDREEDIDDTYLSDFSFIPKKMNKLELTDVLIQLKKQASKSGNQGAKANLLLGNFFYNTTSMGHYRYLLNFDLNNRNGPKYHDNWLLYESRAADPRDYSDKIYFKNFEYSLSYLSDYDQSLNYYKNGLEKVRDEELQARLLFAASQPEQGLFYQKGERKFDKENEHINRYSNEYQEALIRYKVKNYRTYFDQLRENFEGTEYYREVQSSCASFEYYTTKY